MESNHILHGVEQALSDIAPGLLADGPEGQPSPLEVALAEVGLPVQTVSVKSIHPVNGAPPITLYDWVRCPHLNLKPILIVESI
jgi:hypothetical protein